MAVETWARIPAATHLSLFANFPAFSPGSHTIHAVFSQQLTFSLFFFFFLTLHTSQRKKGRRYCDYWLNQNKTKKSHQTKQNKTSIYFYMLKTKMPHVREEKYMPCNSIFESYMSFGSLFLSWILKFQPHRGLIGQGSTTLLFIRNFHLQIKVTFTSQKKKKD